MSNTHVGAHPMIPRFIRLFSVPILLGWLALTVLMNVIAPQLEKVGEAHAVSLAPNDAPSLLTRCAVALDPPRKRTLTPPLDTTDVFERVARAAGIITQLRTPVHQSNGS